MICPKCGVQMEIGQAIDPKDDGCRCIVPYTRELKADEIEFIDCWKCPKCGHSDDGVAVVKKYIGDQL